MFFTHLRRVLVAAVALAATAACTVHDTTPPPLTGPSELALTLRVTATPDSIPQDGGSQSSIRVTAIGPDGRTLSAVPVRLDMLVQGQPQDFGTLSARTIVTGSDGTATVVFTAPPAPPNGIFQNNCRGGVPGNCVSIVASATATNSATVNPQSVDIRLLPIGVILPPGGTPTAAFTVTPTPVQINLPATFNATASTPGTNATSLTYSWSFGDGATASGAVVSHTFTQASTFTVTLTVTNDRGVSATTTQQLTVGSSTPPTGDWVFSPTAPVVGDNVTFNAAGVRPATGRTITSYRWDFNDGSASKSGVVVSHDFGAPGTYNVTLTVTDDAGQSVVISKQVAVGPGNPTAILLVTKTGGLSVSADGNGSSAQPGHSIANYTFLWGDGNTTDAGTTPSATHTYGVAGSYTVTLRIRDDLGRVATATQSVTVP